MPEKILIIEDEPAILLGLKDELSQDYETFTAATGKEGLKLALQKQPDLALLDLILPDIDGFTVCRQFKEKGIDASIIMLTARDQVVDKVKGLELGADDYITKPFSLEELKARIKALLRRKQRAPIEEYDDGILQIDFTKYRAKRKQRPLKLSSLEFKLLRFLISRKGEVISRQELLEQVWGYEVTPTTRTVDVHILSLRRKIGKSYLSTMHREGYSFQAPS
jgi:DNA-binding response OmpR family regulator